MTTIQLYRKHKAGEISKEKFLYEVRRDNNLPFITNLTSYDDAVKILKNKGIVTEGQTKEAKEDEAVKAEVKAKAPSTKKSDSLHIDQANPYEYRHGLQHELNELGEYTDEALEKAKDKVLKNLAKDANFYSSLLNAKVSPFEFKKSETDAKGMQANADGHLKKELKKDEKANVQDSLGKKEAGKKKPKGVKVMSDKGVTGSEKTIKEGIEEHHNDPNFPGGNKIHAMLDKVADEWGKDSDVYSDLEDAIVGWSDRNGELSPKGILAIKNLLSNWDMLDDYEQFLSENIEEDIPGDAANPEEEFNSLLSKYDWYYEMSDDPRTYDRGIELDKKLAVLGKQIGVDKAVELFNAKAPSDRKVTTSFFMEGEDKHAKLKEILKKKVKEAIYKKAGSGGKEDLALASSPKSKSELTKKGYVLIPGTEDAVGLK